MANPMTQPATNTQVMTCFEHQWLTRADFFYPQDFDYLIEQELACFEIKVKQAQLCLVVSHYLAKVVLPSGQVLEILPKVSHLDMTVKHNQANDIESARAWVATMLADVGIDAISKPLSATSLESTMPDSRTHVHSASANASSNPSLKQNIIAASVNTPWYEGVLALAQQKIAQAAQLLPNRYQTQVKNHPQAQGKLNLSAQLKNNWHRPHYLYSEQSVFVIDSRLLGLLVTGWSQLQRLLPGKLYMTPDSLQGNKPLSMAQCRQAYQQFQQQSIHSGWSSQLTPRQVAGLTEGLNWCWWLLTQGATQDGLKANPQQNPDFSSTGLNASATSTQGFDRQLSSTATLKAPAPAVMINMNHAFERWVTGKLLGWVEQNLPDSRLLIQPSLDWLVNSNVTQTQVVQKLTPDVCISDAQGKITHVIDIKYKAITSAQQISSRDWQQLFVYQQYLSCQNGWLIYPKTENFAQRLDVRQNIDDNSRHHQHDELTLDAERQQMSAIAFDLSQAALLL
ncbi:hypothetical protein A6J60_009760 [Psychrobacter sp. FDAARGOS_221]|nr:hypothetical protein A6J60_009760 [Psychrobacter sp. FDAARGOS_221]